MSPNPKMKYRIPPTQRLSSNFSFAHTQKLSREKFPHQKIFIHNHASRRFQQTSACNFASSLVLTIRILDHSSFLVQLPYHRKKLWYSSSSTPHSLAIFVHKIGIFAVTASHADSTPTSQLVISRKVSSLFSST